MNQSQQKSVRRSRRRIQIRKRVLGTPTRPRISIYRSLNHMYAQVIADLAGRTIASASTRESALGLEKTGHAAAAVRSFGFQFAGRHGKLIRTPRPLAGSGCAYVDEIRRPHAEPAAA